MFKKMIAAIVLAGVTAAVQANESHIYKFDNVAWQPAGIKGAEMAILWGNEANGTAIWAFRLQPGVAIPPHTHTRDYWGLAVQGKWAHIDAQGKEVVTKQGAYVHIRANEPHADRCVGPKVCINLIDFDGSRDIAFPESSKQ